MKLELGPSIWKEFHNNYKTDPSKAKNFINNVDNARVEIEVLFDPNLRAVKSMVDAKVNSSINKTNSPQQKKEK